MLHPDDVIDSLPRLTIQWLAGFFDGEGSVSGSKSGESYTVDLTITQKDPKILTLINSLFGDSGRLECFTGVNGAKCHRLRWRGRGCLPVLEALKDHTVTKRRQVETGIELLSYVKEIPSPGISTESLMKRFSLYFKLQALNKRGNVSGVPKPEKELV